LPLFRCAPLSRRARIIAPRVFPPGTTATRSFAAGFAAGFTGAFACDFTSAFANRFRQLFAN
jgi:hypothetical protein